ncbi:MAG: LacI family DNA-binding transcriptional regulator [Eubacteriales bacterium]|nr:LacI family DNA-binding transcriptional regulator [Eubacteriales bacterium]
MAVTIKDVAREAGVAISTVSRYINGAPVKPENEKAIEAAIKQLKFSPNRSARGLKNLRTYTVGVVMQQVDTVYSAKLAVSIEKYLNAMGCAMVLCCHEGSVESAREYVEFLTEQMVDGILLCSVPLEEDFLGAAVEAGIPIVGLEDRIEDCRMDVVRVDGVTSSYELVEGMVRKGHRKIAIINGAKRWTAARERLRGYLRVLEDYEIPVREEWILDGDFREASGYEGMKRLWEQEERPTAVFAANYYICVGVMRAVQELRIRVPEELSVVSFDDHILSVMVEPKLTAVEQPLEQVAAEACRLLQERIEKKETGKPRTVRLKARVIPRDSVGPA